MADFQSKVIAALQGKIPGTGPVCPMCRTADWAVQPGVYWIQERIRSGWTESVSQGLPSAALVCKNCGNTQYINLLVLGNQFKEYL